MNEVQHFFSRAYNMDLPKGTKSVEGRKIMQEAFMEYIAKQEI